MLSESSTSAKWIMTLLFFPYFFQEDLVAFAWGADDPPWLMVLKRIFLLLPVGAILVGLWTTIVSVLSVIIREKRRKYATQILLSWWDLGRSILHFWMGLFKAFFVLVAGLFGLFKVLVVGLWFLFQDIVMTPFRGIRALAENVLKPGVPWIAVVFTVFWSLIEAIIFTYVLTPLVVDTLSNMTGESLSETFVRIPLFLFMLFLVLGSYAVLSAWSESLRAKNVANIIKITLVELVAMLVEVLFLYREFVDSLVPWFSQHSSGGFELGIVGTLAISFFVWLGIRGMTWFLFASHGTPTIMAIIQGSGLRSSGAGAAAPNRNIMAYTSGMFQQMKSELDWIQKKGEEVLNAFILPPLQVLAAAVNFCTLLLVAQHVFDLPFRSVSELVDTKTLLKNVKG